MTDRLLIDTDSNGVSEFAHFDADGNLLGLEFSQDVEPILERNKAIQNAGTRGYGPSREWRHVAGIPPIFMIKWAIQKGVPLHLINSREGLDNIAVKMTRDPDYRFLRTDL